MEFYGRQSELGRIEALFGSPGQAAMLVYGRRRIGKSELLKQALRQTGMRSVYFECKQTSEANNAQSLAVLIADRLGFPPLAFGGIEAVLEFLFEQARREPIVLVLDEYPYLRNAVKGMDSILQSLLDSNAGKTRLKLVLCGSFMDTMKSLLEERNPLYGRFDLTIALEPMDYYDSARFYPSFSDADKVRLYSVFGGVPYYNRLVDGRKSVRDNIIDLVASPGARLENEIALHLHSEMSKMTNANEVFEALAAGAVKFSDVLSQAHVSSSPTLADVLERLMRMGMVEKTSPINDPANKRKAGYFISDRLSAFYYRYVFPYSSQISVMEPRAFYARFVEADFEEQFVPRAFEDVCRQFLVRANRAGRMSEPFFRIGRYAFDDRVEKRSGEFDVVTEDDKGYVFYEAKFKARLLGRKALDAERAQVDASPLECYRYGFFSRSGFSCQPHDDEVFYTLGDVYGEC